MGKPCEKHEYQYKFVLVGDSGVGKTRLFAELTGKECDIGSKSTIGVEFGSKIIEQKESTLKAQVWDTTGQERFRAMTRPYYRGVSGAIITFNTAQIETFENISWWLDELHEYCDTEIVLMLVAHRIDLKREPAVTTEQAQTLADKHKMSYVETSVIDSTDFEASFSTMVRKVHKVRIKRTTKDEIACVRCLRNARKLSSCSESDSEPEENRSSFYV